MMIGKGIEDIDIAMPKDAYNVKDVPTFNAYLTAIVRDSEGRVVKVHRQRSHSPTANFIGLILPVQYFININGSYTLTNTGGNTCSYKPNIPTLSLNIPYPNNNSTGNFPTYLVTIQVGNGSQSNPLTTTKLASPIANGSGSGQLLYGAVSIPSGFSTSGSEAYFYISQTFNNQSGGTVTITEVGIVLQLWVTATAYLNNSSYYVNCGQMLVWYDVLSSSISVPAGGSLTIAYTFTVNP
jgi:hypothetical protein